MAHVLASELRDAVLQAAFQGKLTTKDDSDGNVWVALSELNETKQKLIRQKKIKKEAPLSALNNEEFPYDIPEHWVWIRLGEVIDCGSGSTPLKGHPEYYSNGTIPWLKTGELNNSFITNYEDRITEEAFNKGSFRVNKPGDILIAMYGATIGKLGICTFETTTNQACLGCTPYSILNNMYLFYYFKSAKDALVGKAEGGAQPNISRIKVRNHPIPLPPIEEQARIVAKIDELMTEIDGYEKLEKELTELKEKFPGEMRDAILQAAMEGRITERLSDDAPVVDLINKNKINIKDKKNKKSQIIENQEERPFDVPDKWSWIKLKEIIKECKRGRGLSKQDIKSKGTPVILYGQLYTTYTDSIINVASFVDKEIAEKCPKVNYNDVLLPITSTSPKAEIGRPSVYLSKQETFFGSDMIALSHCIDSKFLLYLMNSSYFIKAKMNYVNGITIKHLNVDGLLDISIALPPIEEQRRIVDKLDKLLPMCDELVNLC